MKKQISFKSITSVVFIALFMVLSNMVLANGIKQTLQLKKHEDKKISLNMSSEENVNLRISFSDEQKIYLHDEEITATGEYSKVYDMSTLPTGNYFLEVEDDKKITEWMIKVSKDNIDISRINETYIPSFVQQNNMVELKLLNSNAAHVKIIDEDGVELYDEQLNDEDTVSKIFDFSQVPVQNYMIITSIGDRNFRFYVNE